MPSSALEFCMVLESSRPPSAAALSEVDIDFIAGSLLMPTECGRALQNSNWKLNSLMDACDYSATSQTPNRIIRVMQTIVSEAVPPDELKECPPGPPAT